MKTIKNVATLLIVAFTISTSFAQSTDTKKQLINKWAFNKEAMKPVIKAFIEAMPQIAALDESERTAAVEASVEQSIEQSGNMKFDFKADGKFVRTNGDEIINGTWLLSADNKELTIRLEGKPEKKMTIVELSDSKLNLLYPDGKNLILKKE